MKASPKIFMLATATLLLACADLLTGGTGLTGLDAGIFLKLKPPEAMFLQERVFPWLGFRCRACSAIRLPTRT